MDSNLPFRAVETGGLSPCRHICRGTPLGRPRTGDGETLTRFSSDGTTTERYGAAHERPRGGGARRDGVVTGTPTGAAHRRRTPRVGADEMPQEAETIKYGMTVMVLRLMVVDKTARITVNWAARRGLVSD